MGRKLAMTTTVTDDAGQSFTFQAGNELPDWAADRVPDDHPFAWGSPEKEAEDLHDLTVQQLLKLAKDRNVEVSATKKDDIIAELEQAGVEAEGADN